MLVDISSSKFEFCEEEYVVHNNLDRLENVRASNSFISSSFLSFPETPSIINKTGVPFGLVTKPFANNEKVVEINMGQELLRCNFCKTYINPFFRIENGFFMCNICGKSQIVPEFYIERLQKYQKSNLPVPELFYMSSDFLAPFDYTTRAPQPPCFFFIIDVSTRPSLYLPYVEALGEFLYHRIDYLIKYGGGRTQIGFLSFDKTIQFYHLSPKLRKPQMLVVGDINDLLLPVESMHLMTNLEESKSLVRYLVKKLKEGKMFGTNKSSSSSSSEQQQQQQQRSSCLGAALNISGRVLGKIGGKLICLTSSYPTIGPLSFVEKDNDFTDVQFMDKRVKFLKLAKIYSREQISVDFHFFSRNKEPLRRIGVAPLSVLSQCTGGQVYYYDYNVFDPDGKKEEEECCFKAVFRSRMKRLFHSEIAFESVLRVRVSFAEQLEIRKYYGCYFLREKDLIIAPVFSGDKSIAVEIGFRRNKDNKKKKKKTTKTRTSSSSNILSKDIINNSNNFESQHLSGEKQVFFQVAVLHTSLQGDRKIRVHNYFVPIVTNVRDFLSSIHPNVMTNLLLRIVSKDMLDGGILKRQKFQEMYLMKKVVQALQCHKRFCLFSDDDEQQQQQQQQHQQLLLQDRYAKKIFPVQLELLVKLVYGALSNLVFTCESTKTIGEKISFLVRMLSNYPDVTQLATVPKFYDILDNNNNYIDQQQQQPQKKMFRGLTQRGLESTGCYLLQTDELLYLFVGHQFVTGSTQEDVLAMKEIKMIIKSFNCRKDGVKWEISSLKNRRRKKNYDSSEEEEEEEEEGEGEKPQKIIFRSRVANLLEKKLEELERYHFYTIIPVSVNSGEGMIAEFNRLLIERNSKRTWEDYIQQIFVSL